MRHDRIDDLPVSDEQLMALADGELSGADADALHARIEADHGLAERFALFVETRALLATPQATAGTTGEPGLDRLAAAIRASDARLTPKAASEPRFTVVQSGAGASAAAQAPRLRAARFRVAAPAIAAALALMVGGVLGYGAGRITPGAAPEAGIVAVAEGRAARAALASALETTPSGEQLAWSDDDARLTGAISVVATHRLRDGRVCREYEASVAARDERAIGLGCRGADGRWVTEIVARAAGSGADYATASGASVVEQALEGLGSDGAVASADERKLIEQRWAGDRRP